MYKGGGKASQDEEQPFSCPELVLYRGPLLERCAEEWVLQERRVRE
jgi:hypothetical protein